MQQVHEAIKVQDIKKQQVIPYKLKQIEDDNDDNDKDDYDKKENKKNDGENWFDINVGHEIWNGHNVLLL